MDKEEIFSLKVVLILGLIASSLAFISLIVDGVYASMATAALMNSQTYFAIPAEVNADKATFG